MSGLSLSLLIGTPLDLAGESPILVLNDPETGRSIEKASLIAVEKPGSWPEGLETRHCTGAEWRMYRLDVSAEEWRRYWDKARDYGFSYGIAFVGLKPIDRPETFGFAFIDRSTGQVTASCGCLWR